MSVDLDNPGDCAQWARLLEAATKERNDLRAEVASMARGYRDLHDMLPGNKDVWSKVDDLRTALATALAERDAARDIWFCLECGITVPDAEHCCPTCGRDCIGFENGKPAHGMGAWLDKERALDAALAYQLKSPVTGAEQTLGHLMQERYGREARQWQANHDQRKAERDAAITERDALRGEVERIKAAGAWKPSEIWREEVADEVAEQIATFVDAEAEVRREEGFSYRAVSELAADIRSGSWRKEPK